jgi:hypothetical protein
VVVAIGWVWLVHRRRSDAALMAVGTVAAGVLIDVPFLVASRGEMWSMVVTAQLRRSSAGSPFAVRLADLSSAYWPRPDAASPGIIVSAALGSAVMLAVLALAWRVPAARLPVALTVAALATLLLSPSWFEQYADFAAAPVALCAAAAAQSLPDRLRLAGWLPAVGAAAVTAAVLMPGNYPATVWWGPPAMTAAAQDTHCVTSDTPAGLIALDVLDRDLAAGCTVWVDPIGRALLDFHEAGPTLATNTVWQQEMVRYLRSGQLAYPYLLRRPLDAASMAELAQDGTRLGIRADGRTFVLYRVSGQ